jgi:hypothetical protein
MTKTEFARLVRIARKGSHFRMSSTEIQLYCPMDIEAKKKDMFDRTAPHKFEVPHLPWMTGLTVAEVTEALARHLDPEWELCPHAKP